MSQTNGHANGKPQPQAPALRAELAAKRMSNRLLSESIRERRLERLAAVEQRRDKLYESMSVDWVTPYLDMLDRFRRDPAYAGPASLWQRQKGRNYPIYQTEAELALLRAPARILLSINSYAIGLMEGLTSYVIGPGYTYRAAKKKKQRTDPSEDAVIDQLAEACQERIDLFLAESEWYGGERPGIEEEFFWRSCEDGETLLLHFARDDGGTEVRTAEPEQLTCPPGEDQTGEWSFGILTPDDDVQVPEKYNIQWSSGNPEDRDEFTPDEVTHFRRNVKRSMKRGITDFSFSQLDALELADRLRTNLGDAAAQQASIVGIRQHSAGTQQQIQAFVDGDKDFDTRDPMTGTTTPTRRYRKGGWEDIPESMQYVAGPIAQSQPIHLQVLQGLLRSAGVRWNAPEWLGSGDASNSNYAGQLVAESPFVRTTIRRQRAYGSAFARTMWVVIENAARAGCIVAGGRAWTIEEIRREIDVKAEPVSPETRNKLQEAQQAAIEIPLGTDSRQRFAQSQGRDWDQVTADNEQWLAENGGMGGVLPLPDDQGGGPSIGGPPRNALGESLSLWESLLEARTGLVKKKITDKNGVERTVYVRGGEPDAGKGKDKGRSATTERPTVEKTVAHVNGLRSNFTTEGLVALAQSLHGHTVAELKEIKQKLGVKASGRKAELAKKIAERALASEKPAAKIKPTAKATVDHPPEKIAAAVEALTDELIKSKYFRTGGVPIHELRDAIRSKLGDKAASHEVLDPILKQMRVDGKHHMVAVTMNPGVSKDQMDGSVPGVNETLFYIEKPQAPAAAPAKHADAKQLSATMGDMTEANHARIATAIDDAHAKMPAGEFAAWASTLLGFQVKGSKAAVHKQAHAFINSLRTSRTQTDGY